jgi:ComF family protein
MRWLLDLIFPPTSGEQIVRSLTASDIVRFRSQTTVGNVGVLASYRSREMRALIWELKYHGNTHAAELLGTLFREAVCTKLSGPWMIVPVPLATARKNERGYNQVALVASRAIQNLSHISLATDVMSRIRATPPQTRLSRKERLLNVHGAFTVRDPARIEGKRVLLVDDVVTTGATLAEAARVLTEAGASEVRMIALAH